MSRECRLEGLGPDSRSEMRFFSDVKDEIPDAETPNNECCDIFPFLEGFLLPPFDLEATAHTTRCSSSILSV